MDKLAACDSCRVRKSKCLKDHPCSNCKEHGRKCIYSPKTVRSPLTRAYLTQIEKKVATLENILRRMIPEDVEVQDLIRASEKEVPENLQEIFQINLTPSDIGKQPATLKNIKLLSEKPLPKSLKPMEFQPEDYLINIKNKELNYFDERGYNTSDNVYDSSIDGMAALSNDTGLSLDTNSGYFGINSSHGLLKFLQLKSERNGNSIVELSLEDNPETCYDDTLLDEEVNAIWTRLATDNIEDLLDNREFQAIIVHSFFETYYQVYPIINKKRFFRNYIRFQQRSSVNLEEPKTISFMVLLFTILALGLWCKFGENSHHLYYYKRVKYYSSQINMFEYSDTQLLDSFVLLSNYVQKTDKPNTCWSYLGMATRIATSLGFHKEVRNQGNDPNLELFEDLEIRKRQWWGMYFFDVGTTLTFGRPLTIPPLSTIDLEPVSNIDDNLLNTPNATVDQIKVKYPTIYTTLIYESELTKVSTRIYNYNCSVLKLQNDKSKMIGLLDMNELLNSFIQTLPPFYHEDEMQAVQNFYSFRAEGGYTDASIPKWFGLLRLRLLCRYHNLRILIFRYILWENTETKDITYYGLVKKCKGICYDSSFASIIIVESFVANNELDYLSAWYATYFLFQAVLIPILKIVIDQDRNQTENQEELFRYIETAKATFAKLNGFNKLAGKFIKLMDLLLYGKKQDRLWNDMGLGQMKFDMFDNIFEDIWESNQ